MHYKIVKLDARYSYHNDFGYLLEFPRRTAWSDKVSGVLAFDRARKWFSLTYGWSQDCETRLDIVGKLQELGQTGSEEINELWAYSIKYNEYRIYVKDESVLTMFELRWRTE